jgi:hypothetical protein
MTSIGSLSLRKPANLVILQVLRTGPVVASIMWLIQAKVACMGVYFRPNLGSTMKIAESSGRQLLLKE